MQRVVLDSNAVDPLVDLPGAQEAVRAAVQQGQLEVLYHHVTVEELAVVSDYERRVRLLLAIISVGRLITTGAVVLGNWRLGFDRFGSAASGQVVKAVQAGNTEKNTRDALYAATAVAESCDLVTNDAALTKKAAAEGVNVISTHDFLTGLGFTP